ncbi:MAG: flagella basal body P-ring formation protein FlgA [Alphaproteobacteria bacterium]|nr:flagella basal body P-ring formation protein FlgA [Alphaproteobacteria bacterium]HCQ71237.1 flagella basal body P-ring formation protein FlgA [Rhodospirillaceae bacterium]|tara:strand:+ start:6833 stop:7753 length:921 start_codon:yes stop_codon:yes gene_type:complete
MLRFVYILAVLAFISTDAMAVSLRQQSVISGDVIRLGDLFHDLERNQDRVLGAAPRPGKSTTLSAKTLQRVAIAMDLPWRPSSASDYLTVTRAATVVSPETVEGALRTALSETMTDSLFNIAFTGAQPEVILPPEMPDAAEISELEYNAQSRWFEATIMAPSKDNPVIQKRISGKIIPLAQIPTLKSSLRSGDVIGRHDIRMITVPMHSVNHDTYLRAEDLYGLTPRRIITAGSAIKEMDVEQPRIVQRGESVTMIYQHGGMRLTATGKAMEFGAKGDLIRVVNNQSSQSIDAIVTGTQEVTVKTF